MEYVIHVSVDGLRADLLQSLMQSDNEGNFGSFRRLVDEGASTFNARTDYSHTVTIPNHTSMLTGRPVLQPPGQPNTVHHGYTNNSDPGPNDKTQDVKIHFKRPVLGHTLVRMRLELGRSPLGQTQALGALEVVGAKGQRGYAVAAAEAGVDLESPAIKGLRQVHTGSLPRHVPNAQYAYRFREGGWSLSLDAKKKPSGSGGRVSVRRDDR